MEDHRLVFCTGWHAFTEKEYQEKVKEHGEKEENNKEDAINSINDKDTKTVFKPAPKKEQIKK